ncbi:hypothetical protein GCK72_018305 [Caenorhabditis remanei]|uniref:Uncharacterized protein n=1 Tax=Caenorhabditis remanei TaxID=31234 RepID=A0A6A5GAE4_CAERE|nr:hypothetical protein GCK72_018305 [Caenorhabditis remanei]KAF1751751.1 hypothetical protein GCK72_018305 [Caenorhabditis remanei]
MVLPDRTQQTDDTGAMSSSGQQEVNESSEQNDGVVSAELRNLTIPALDEKYKETIKTITTEHMLKTESLEKEMKERCDRIDEEYKQECAAMKQDHEKALKEISENLNQERDGRRILVAQLEEQLQQEQRERENQLELEHIRLKKEALDRHLRVENSRDVVGELINILRPVYDVGMSLKKIKIICFYSRVDGFAVPPGELDQNFRIIQEIVESFHLHVVNYWKFMKNTSYTTAQFSETCSKLIEEITSTMKSEELISIYERVPRAIESGQELGKFDEVLEKHSKGVDELVSSVERGIEKLISEHIFSFTNILAESSIPQLRDNNEERLPDVS